MAAKKAAAPSVCELGGPEIQAMGLKLTTADVVQISAWSCGTAADIQIMIMDSNGQPQVLVDQQGATNVSATLPTLVPGLYSLVWSFLEVSTPWQTRVDVTVNSTDRFRQRKDSKNSQSPFLRGFLLLQVVP